MLTSDEQFHANHICCCLPCSYGSYTDDTQMAVALARSLIEQGHVDPGHAAAAYAADFDPFRGYGGTAVKVRRALQRAGTVLELYPKHAGYVSALYCLQRDAVAVD